MKMTRSRSGAQPGLFDRKGARPYAPRVPESQVQAGMVEAAELYGYRMKVTSRQHRRARCPECGHWFWPHDPTGCDRGIGDLLARNEGKVRGWRRPWPPALWAMCEVKPSPEAFVRPEQRELIDAGSMVLAYNSQDLLEELERLEELLGDGNRD